MHADYRLQKILEDLEHPFGKKVQDTFGAKNDTAKRLYFDVKKAIESVATEGTDEEALKNLLIEYQEDFNLPEVERDMRGFIAEGKTYLALVNADDADEDVEAHFITSNQNLKDVLAKLDIGDDVYVVVHTGMVDGATRAVGILEDDTMPRGAFLSAYELSKGMTVFVMMPGVSNVKF